MMQAMSLTSVTRRDGTTGVEVRSCLIFEITVCHKYLQAGILRQAVDGFGNMLFHLARPLMEAVGLGAVAREEVSQVFLIITPEYKS